MIKYQLNLFESAMGSKTVIFFLSIVSNPESFKSPNLKRPTLNCLFTNIIKNKDEALIKLPVKIVIKIAVFFGLNFKILNLALPIFEPNKSPNVEIKPPSSNKKIMKSQPAVSYTHLTLPTKRIV